MMKQERRLYFRAAMMLLMMMLTTMTAWAETETVSYIDANGETQSVTTTILTGSEGILGSNDATTWYVVNDDISYTHSISCYGNVNIILTDGKTMTVSNNGVCIQGEDNKILTIYGQTTGTGTLNATTTSEYGDCISFDNIVINGGIVSAKGQYGIHCDSIAINDGTVTATGEVTGICARHRITHNVTINGGKVTATGSWGIHSNGGIITLGWKNADDFIKVSEYTGTVNIKSNQAFMTDDEPAQPVSGTVDDRNLIDGKKLTPAHFTDNGDDTYTIWTAAGWGVFCDALQDNDTYNRFSGKTVYLANDIGSVGSPVTRIAGTSQHDFCGTFDGQNHTLTVNISSDNDHDYTAPFSYISETTPTGSSEVSHPVICNLNVAGNVTATKNYAGGIVGAFWGTLTIENCSSNVDITTSNKHAGGFISCALGDATITNCNSSSAISSSVNGDGTHGGFIGKLGNNITVSITGCLFGGSLIGSSTTHCAGFVGYNGGTLSITNSLFYPGQKTVSGTGSATFARGNAPTLTNCYYTEALGEAQGKQRRNIEAGDNVTIGSKALTGSETEYNVSGITAYSDGGLHYDNGDAETLYYGDGNQVSLTLTNDATGAPAGYRYAGYSVTDGATITGNETDGFTLTMADDNVTVSVDNEVLAPVDWTTVNEGTEGDPYIIYNKDQLDLLAQRVNSASGDSYAASGYSGKYFELANDIEYSYTTDWDDAESTENNYTAIAGYFNNKERYFNGIFDGQGHTVSGIRIYKGGNNVSHGQQGLFGWTGSSAVIRGITLADAQITGNDDTGGIVGRNPGTVTDCHVAADVAIHAVSYLTSEHGGIVGWNEGGTVSNCTSAATLTKADNIGAARYYGGIAGKNNGGTLINNFAIGAVVPEADGNYYGAICGENYAGANNTATLRNNYYHACKVASNDVTPSGVGCGHVSDNTPNFPNYYVADVTDNDGAVPAWGLAGGADGSESKPYVISHPIELNLLATNVNSGETYENTYFVLGADIAYYTPDDADYNFNNYTAIGNSSHNFKGIFDGQGYIVSGIRIDKCSSDYQGLFGYVYNGTVKNVVLADASIEGNNNVGGIVGYTNSSGTIKNCLVIGTTLNTSISRSARVGVIAGNRTGKILHNYYYDCYLNNTDYDIGAQNSDRGGAMQGIILYDNVPNTGINSYILNKVGNAGVPCVFLCGRTLYKDGDWNTLCLPFGVSEQQIAMSTNPLYGATIMKLDDDETGYNAETGTLSLYFEEADKIEAGKPYLVKWDKAGDYDENPSQYDINYTVFSGVEIDDDEPEPVESDDKNVQFCGIYTPLTLPGDDASNLYLGTENNLYWPSEDFTLNPLRAYFHVDLSDGNAVREIKLNLDSTTGVESVQGSGFKVQDSGAWYDLFGRKLNGKPTQAGMYIHDGKAVVIE